MNEHNLGKTHRLVELETVEQGAFRFIYDRNFAKSLKESERNFLKQKLEDFREKYQDESLRSKLNVIGRGQGGGSTVYELEGTRYCIKIAGIADGKDIRNKFVVGNRQEDIFNIQNIWNQLIKISESVIKDFLNEKYLETSIRPVAGLDIQNLKIKVAPVLAIIEDGKNVYQLMERIPDVRNLHSSDVSEYFLAAKIYVLLSLAYQKGNHEISEEQFKI